MFVFAFLVALTMAAWPITTGLASNAAPSSFARQLAGTSSIDRAQAVAGPIINIVDCETYHTVIVSKLS